MAVQCIIDEFCSLSLSLALYHIILTVCIFINDRLIIMNYKSYHRAVHCLFGGDGGGAW